MLKEHVPPCLTFGAQLASASNANNSGTGRRNDYNSNKNNDEICPMWKATGTWIFGTLTADNEENMHQSQYRNDVCAHMDGKPGVF